VPSEKYFELSISAAERAAEDQIWRHLGITVPLGGLLLEHPLAAPLSSRSLLFPSRWWQDACKDRESATTVRANNLRADLPLLKTVLETCYSGWEVAASQGWCWDDMFEKWDRRLAKLGSDMLPISRAFWEWAEFERFQPDGHSGPLTAFEFTQSSRCALLTKAPASTCTAMTMQDGSEYELCGSDPAQQPHPVLVWDGKDLCSACFVSYPAGRGLIRSISTSTQTITAANVWDPSVVVPGYTRCQQRVETLPDICWLTKGRPNAATYHMIAPGIGYLRMPTFNGEGSIRSVIASKSREMGSEFAVIFDLRMNGGGGWPCGIESVWRRLPPSAHIGKLFTQRIKHSRFSEGLRFSRMQRIVTCPKHPIGSDLQNMQRLLHAATRPPESDSAVCFSSKFGSWSLRRHAFKRQCSPGATRIIVLVDAGSASDCEAFLSVAASLPESVIVGTSTFGMGQFTHPEQLLLPHSRTLFSIATSLSDPYGDGRSIAGYGFAVDILLSTEAASSASSLIRLAYLLTS
jgi:hypothetical protein